MARLGHAAQKGDDRVEKGDTDVEFVGGLPSERLILRVPRERLNPGFFSAAGGCSASARTTRRRPEATGLSFVRMRLVKEGAERWFGENVGD